MGRIDCRTACSTDDCPIWGCFSIWSGATAQCLSVISAFFHTLRIGVCRELLQIGDGDIERETEMDLQFHEAIAAASHNELWAGLMRSLQDVLRQYIALASEMTDRASTTASEHLAIYEAIVAKDPAAAGRAMVEHLRISRSVIFKSVR